MTEPLRPIPVTLRWDGIKLMLGRIEMGRVFSFHPEVWTFRMEFEEGFSKPFDTEPAARAALLAAAVRALGGES